MFDLHIIKSFYFCWRYPHHMGWVRGNKNGNSKKQRCTSFKSLICDTFSWHTNDLMVFFYTCTATGWKLHSAVNSCNTRMKFILKCDVQSVSLPVFSRFILYISFHLHASYNFITQCLHEWNKKGKKEKFFLMKCFCF